MSDPNTPGTPGGNSSNDDSVEQRLKNQHSEFDRKIKNIQQLIEDQNKNFSTVLNTIAAAPQKQAAPSKKLQELIYDDPEEYARIVSENAKKQAEEHVTRVMGSQQQQQVVLNQLVSDYPELADQNNDMTKRAIEIFKNLSDSEKAQPSSYKLAVREAAAEYGVLPSSKRSRSDSDGFTFNGSNSQRSGPSEPAAGKISDATLAFAQAIGKNIDDPKYIERLKKAASRKDWTRFRSIK